MRDGASYFQQTAKIITAPPAITTASRIAVWICTGDGCDQRDDGDQQKLQRRDVGKPGENVHNR
jgi:hypothetical protein